MSRFFLSHETKLLRVSGSNPPIILTKGIFLGEIEDLMLEEA